MKDNPSLQPYLPEALPEAYENAKDLAMGETDLPEQPCPSKCPYQLTQILDDRFDPGEPGALVVNSKS